MNEFQMTPGADVHCTDGKCGRLSKFVIDPETRHLTHIVVEAGFLLKHGHVFPISIIESATREDIQLSIHSEEVANYNEYRMVEVEQVVATAESGLPLQVDTFGAPTVAPRTTKVRERVHKGVSPKLTVIDRNTTVNNPEGTIGPILHLFVAAGDGQLLRLVTRQGMLKVRRPVMEVDLIEDISEERVFINALNEEIKNFPDYSDSEEEDKPMVQVQETASTMVDEFDAREEGTAAVSSATEIPVARQIEIALASDPRTQDAVIEVIDERGVIMLMGEVDRPQIREAADEIARGQSGVVSVVNNLRVR